MMNDANNMIGQSITYLRNGHGCPVTGRVVNVIEDADLNCTILQLEEGIFAKRSKDGVTWLETGYKKIHINSMNEVNNISLEDQARQYAITPKSPQGSILFIHKNAAFKAGAQWQKEQNFNLIVSLIGVQAWISDHEMKVKVTETLDKLFELNKL